MHSLEPYSDYKESGVPWLGKIPAHWDVRRLKHMFSRIVGGATPNSGNSRYWDGNVVWVTPADISKKTRIRKSLRQITLEGLQSCSTEIVPAGSIIVTCRAPVGNLALAETELCTNQGCKALVVDDTTVNSVFGINLLTILRDEIQSYAAGTTFTEISTPSLSVFRLPLPPFPEQAAIARFLDHVERRTQHYIRTKEKLIALLEEQKQAIIQQAVTGQIDVRTGQPYPAYKPSGVEWLGDVPEHWEVIPSRAIFSEIKEKNWPQEQMLSVTIRNGVIRQKELLEDTTKKDSSRLDKANYILVQPYDIAYNKMRAWQGAIGMSKYRGIISPAYVVQRPREQAIPFYLHYLLRTQVFSKEAERWSYGITSDMWSLRPEHFKMIYICLPPLPEQDAIVHFLDEAAAELDQSIVRTRRQIDLLREYRTRLIADVVTGKLDVREAAARLPEEDDEKQLEEDSPFADDLDENDHAAADAAEDPEMTDEIPA